MVNEESGNISLRIFISYGHDDHSIVAEKLKDDLVDSGHEVWFDLERLKPGVDYEQYIEDGLEWVAENPEVGRIIFMMTPHSVRRPDGYCLNELRRFLDRGKVDPIPVMLVWCEPPLSICRLQWLDMQDCVPLEENKSNYKKKFKELLDTLKEGEVEYGPYDSLKNDLRPLDFDVDILGHVERFIGRKWVLDKIDSWIKKPNKSRIFWICGNPGTGKTAIASWLCEKRRQVAAFHLCQHGDTIRSDPRRCIMSIAYQLSTQIPEYQERLKVLKLGDMKSELNASTLFKELIVNPLSKIPQPQNAPLIILIDALDEATIDGKNELAKFISKDFNKTPEWLRLIITSRQEPEVMGPLQGLNPYILDTELPENLKDIEDYLKKELKPYFDGGDVDQQVIDKILDKSEGNFLYVDWIRRDLEEGNLKIKDVDQFPQGLGSIYFDFFGRKFPDTDYYEENIAPALDIISAAQEPLDIDFISTLMGWTGREKDKFLRKTSSLFSNKNGEIQAFHKSLMDWLTNPEKAGDYYVSEDDGHNKLAREGWDIYKKDLNSLGTYFLSHLPYHLIKSGLWDEIHEILTDLNYIEAKCAAGITYELIKDYNLTLDFLPEAQKEKKEKKEHEERVQKYIKDLIAYSQGKTNQLDVIPSVKLWSEEKLRKETERIIHNPTRLDRIKAFSKFINLQSYALAEFGYLPGFTIQQAYNSADTGPVAEAAKIILDNDFYENLILREINWLPEYNPFPLLLKILEGHNGVIRALDISSDCRTSISGSDDRTLRMWDLETGELLKILEGHKKELNSVSVTANGKIAISGSWDNTIHVWNLESGELIQVLENYTGVLRDVKMTPDGRIAISGSDDGTIRVWNLQTKELVNILEGHNIPVKAVEITPDGKIAISGSDDGTIRVWNLQTKELVNILEGHNDAVNSLSITPDGKTIISGSDDVTIRVWDLKTGEILKLEGNMDWVRAVAITPDGKIAISGSGDRNVHIWDLETGELLRILEGHIGYVWAVEISPDAKTAISGSSDRTIRIWDLETGKPLRKSMNHTDWIRAIASSSDKSIAISGSDDQTIRVWDLETGELLKILEGHTGVVRAVAISPNGETIISGSSDITVRVWDLETGELLKILEGHTGVVRAVAILPDNKTAVSGDSDGIIRVWDLETGELLKILEGHTGVVRAVSVIKKGKNLVTGSGDGTVRVWDLETGELLKILEGHTLSVRTIATTPDGLTAISGSDDGNICVWNLETGKLLKILKGHNGVVRAVTITTDGKIAISGGGDQTIRVWNLKTGKIIAVSKENNFISALDIVYDRHFISGSNNGDIFVSSINNQGF